MKRTIGILLSCILITGLIQAQTEATITNSSVIKMVKARLSDELIIDMIQNSGVNFDLSESAVQNLKAENVSQAVIKEMQNSVPRTASSKTQEKALAQTAVTEKTSEVQKPPVEVTQPEKSEIKELTQIRVINALGSIAPVKSLVTWYETEFETMSVTISGWDNQIKVSLDEVARINNDISGLESQLREKKNANANNYDSGILLLYKSLNDDRLKFRQSKEKMLKDGEAITKKLAEISKDQERSMSKEYDDVSQQIKSFESDPSKATDPVAITFSALKLNYNPARNILPATEMCYWYKNELDYIYGMIEEWNKKAREIAEQSVVLNDKLAPMQHQMEEYKTSSKKFKNEISALKKQINATEKEKKQLAAKMETESNQLAEELKKHCKDAQNSAKERFEDIIGNINYYYQEKLNL